jgi:hypothetical protein
LVDLHLFHFCIVIAALMIDGPRSDASFKSHLSLPNAHEGSKAMLGPGINRLV